MATCSNDDIKVFPWPTLTFGPLRPFSRLRGRHFVRLQGLLWWYIIGVDETTARNNKRLEVDTP